MIISQHSRQQGRQLAAIDSLPANPSKPIYWIVNTPQAVKGVEDLIRYVRGKEYFDKYVTVVAKGESTKRRENGIIYFDPILYEVYTQ